MSAASPALRLALPGTWQELPLGDDASITDAVAALVRAHYGRRDDQATFRARQRDRLAEAARRARDAGATQYHLSLAAPGGLAFASSVAEYRPGLPLGAVDDPAAVADELVRVLSPGEAGAHWDRFAAAGGAAFEKGDGLVLRTERRLDPPADDRDAPVAIADYWLTVPGSAAVVLLSFTTALAALAPLLTELFDAVVGAAEWSPGGGSPTGSLRAELIG
ncbi:hypothetical protein [Microbacterium sp. T2.11-28]|uniref:hypothetical protein n=1 Tax=Microbacterium sp. T2.11-28 TaxID=3041169 RepID=UPI0024775F93|nr:hypothetical protein [Microbacterium sp. T2.11-28]CAI9393624.1 hypothetical protein MICABA_02510 [Microbacterium sp. T2.11-28]